MARSTPFGQQSRVQILKQHLSEGSPITAENAWQFIYQELLWIDGSTGLAHLYESDKAQPGRPWYNRTVVFTDMLCERFGSITKEDLKDKIDRLFRAVMQKVIDEETKTPDEVELVKLVASQESLLEYPQELIEAAVESTQETPLESYVPDAELVERFAVYIVDELHTQRSVAEQHAHHLVNQARHYFTIERKRQNVLGEGFEDLLELLMLRVSRVPKEFISIRKRANKLPGFERNTTRERIEAPDLALVRNNRTEILGSVKWSLRHDRQKQLSDELDCYVDLLSQDTFPRYILVTNEYDPGRLVNTDGLNRRGQRIDRIYHINLELLLGVLHNHERLKDLEPLIHSGRLRSIQHFFEDMEHEYSA